MTDTSLMRLVNAVVSNPAFVAKDITGDGKAETFCNWGLQMFAEALFGFDKLKNMRANDIVTWLEKNAVKVTAEEALLNAERGDLVVAAQRSAAGSGHVAMVLPMPLVFSGKWNKKCPVVANVGVKNGVMGANFAFNSEPDYFVIQIA
jgi:hypothetical protein